MLHVVHAIRYLLTGAAQKNEGSLKDRDRIEDPFMSKDRDLDLDPFFEDRLMP